MTDHLDVVAVGCDDERGVVMGVVVGAQSGWAVVLTSGFDRRAMERVDLATALCRERKEFVYGIGIAGQSCGSLASLLRRSARCLAQLLYADIMLISAEGEPGV